ncbi:hypothetical protein [Rhizobium sp. AAP43]|uniref:hypothetical protein n=1 Tax=Rhizobium sp. AAP43 TaxID=1523420 RepID=UPI000B15FD53|nr:hypothetical protein [Rhizobium sp. AAP43]
MRERAENETVRAALLVKQARLSRVLELWRDGVSTDCIAVRLEMDERAVCALLEEVREA